MCVGREVEPGSSCNLDALCCPAVFEVIQFLSLQWNLSDPESHALCEVSVGQGGLLKQTTRRLDADNLAISLGYARPLSRVSRIVCMIFTVLSISLLQR